MRLDSWNLKERFQHRQRQQHHHDSKEADSSSKNYSDKDDEAYYWVALDHISNSIGLVDKLNLEPRQN